MSCVSRFKSRPARFRKDESAEFRGLLLRFLAGDGFQAGRPELRPSVERVLAVLDAETASANKWSFVMVDPEEYRKVVEFLAAHSKRPKVALRLWAQLFCYLTYEGQVCISGAELAKELGVSPSNVSQIMGELVKFGAVTRVRVPVLGVSGAGAVRFFVNPLIGTHLSGKARDDAQRDARKLELVSGSAGPGERRRRSAVVPFVPVV